MVEDYGKDVAKDIDTTDMFDNPLLTNDESKLFIEQNGEIVKKWTTFLDSLYVYALYALYEVDQQTNTPSTAINPIEQMVPTRNDTTYIGNNFINVTIIPGFYEIYFDKPIDVGNTFFFAHQFTEYCYQGKNLY